MLLAAASHELIQELALSASNSQFAQTVFNQTKRYDVNTTCVSPTLTSEVCCFVTAGCFHTHLDGGR